MLRRRPFQGAGRSVHKEAEAGKNGQPRLEKGRLFGTVEAQEPGGVMERWAGPRYKSCLCQSREFGLTSLGSESF